MKDTFVWKTYGFKCSIFDEKGMIIIIIIIIKTHTRQLDRASYYDE